MDETSIHAYNLEKKVVGEKNKEAIEVNRGKGYSNIEGTTFIATTQLANVDIIPLAIVAEGKSERTEKKKKYNVDKSNDELIAHSISGWADSNVIMKYLEWIQEPYYRGSETIHEKSQN